MKKYCLIQIVTVLPQACYANTSICKDLSSLQSIGIFGVLSILLLLLVFILIHFDTKRKDKKSSNTSLSEEIGSQVSEYMDPGKIDDLGKQISEKEEIIRLNNQLSEKEEIIERLNNQISSLNAEISELRESAQKSNVTKKKKFDKRGDKEEEECNQSDNPNSYPLGGRPVFNELTVINGNLVKAESEQTTYYRTWRENGLLLFEFVNNDRTRKAINNRTIVIEPFCTKRDDSKSPDLSEEIETKTPGILNDDYTLKKKAEIIYK